MEWRDELLALTLSSAVVSLLLKAEDCALDSESCYRLLSNGSVNFWFGLEAGKN
jgi:hypothetical protein